MSAEQDYLVAERLLAQGHIEAGLGRLRNAVDAGSAPAMARLAQYLLHFDDATGAETPAQRRRAASDLLQRAHAEGSGPAAYLLALLRIGSEAGTPESIADLLQAAARRGHVDSLRALGVLLAEHSAAPVRQAGLDLLTRAAQSGDALAAQMRSAYQRASSAVTAPAPATDRELDQALLQVLSALAMPATAESLADSPVIARVPELLGAGLCYYVCCFALPRLRSSAVHDPAAGAARHASLRTSSDASIDPLEEDLILRLIQARMAAAAGLPLIHAEHLVVLRYRPGEEYRPHRDTLGPSALAVDRPQAGQRARTLCAYLNPVPAGGETDFPLRGVRVAPSPGAAVFFDNLGSDGRPAEASLHAGLPVLAGEKWLATLWLREQPYRRF
jgi:prolyl 4-hydroxylase